MTEIKVYVENAHGIVEGLNFEASRACADKLSTEFETQGNRIKFKPTRFALDTLVSEFGREVFHPGCRYAWAHFYKDRKNDEAEFEYVTDPYPHQREWFELVKDMPYFAFEWEMGLGKSKTILDICQYDHGKGNLDALLIVTLNNVHRKWIEKEVPAHLPKDFADAVFWNPGIVDNAMWTGPHARQRKDIAKSDKFAIASINFEAVSRKKGEKFCERFLRARKCAIVVDESQYIKGNDSSITKAMLRLAKLADKRWITSGTVSTGSTTDPYSQYKFLHPSIVEDMPFFQWKEEFTIQEKVGDKTFDAWEYNPKTKTSKKVKKPVMTITGYQNEDKLRRMLDPFRSRLLKEDCLDLPPKIYRMKSFEMTDKVRNSYNQMREKFLVEIEGGKTVTATMAMTKLVRLQQISCGFLVPDDRDPLSDKIEGIPIDEKNPRIETLMEELEKVRNKGIIWSYWRYSLREIAEALRAAYGDKSVVEYHGGITQQGKAQALIDFKSDETRWFVGNPQSAGVGLDLVEADNMIYYNNSFNLGLRLQSEDRFHRIGQEALSCTITDIECLGTVDRPQLRALKNKNEVASLISGDNLKSWLTDSI